jgi:hypothetical protein
MDASFMLYMYIQNEAYNCNACHRMVTNKTVDEDGHVWSFLSHVKIFVPVHKHNNHWVIFVICPAERQITVIDSLYDQGQWYVTIFDNLVRFIHQYERSRDLPQDKWAWHMHPVVVNKQLNNDDYGVCLSLAIYCLVHGLDYHTMPPFLLDNQERIFIYYIVMGYQFYQDDTYDSSLDEMVGTTTIVDDDAPAVDYRDYAKRHERGQPTRRATNPPPFPQVTAADLQYPNGDGEISISDDDNEDHLDGGYTEDLPTNLVDTLDQYHDATAVLGLTGMAIAMADQEQEQLEGEDNDGETHEQENEVEGPDNLAELQRQLRNKVAKLDQQIKRYQEISDSSTE